MMLYHVAGFPDARTRIEQARSLLDFLAAQANPGPYADMLKAEAGLLRRKSDGYIYHEFLEPENHPIRLDQFVAKAREKGLGYLGETEISAMTSSAFKPETMEMLDRISGRDLVRMGQYGDFLANRAFRESLLVHGEQKIDRRIDWRAIRPFWVSTLLTPEDPAFDSTSAQPATFVSPIGTQIRLENPTSKVALAILLKTHPQPLAFDHLLEASRARLGSARAMEQDEEELAKFILFAYGHGFFDVLARPWPCTAAITDQPRTSQLSRLQARSGQSVITLNHRHLDDLSPEYRQLIGLLDGEHTIDQVIDIMFQCVEAQLPEESEAREGDPARSRAMIADSVQQMIASLRNAGLLF
jgi:methyltransferase-like protein